MFGGLDTVCPKRLSMPDDMAIVPMAALRSSVRRVTRCASGIDILFLVRRQTDSPCTGCDGEPKRSQRNPAGSAAMHAALASSHLLSVN